MRKLFMRFVDWTAYWIEEFAIAGPWLYTGAVAALSSSVTVFATLAVLS